MAEFKDEKFNFSKVELGTVPEKKTEQKPNQEAKKTVVEAVKPQKKKGGRKSVALPTIEQKLDFVKRDKAIREHEVADFTVKAERSAVRELAVRHLMLNYDITEDYASKITCFIYDNAKKLDGHVIYFDGLQVIAEALGLSYPTVQKTVKKLREKNVITKAAIGQNSYELSAEAERFFKSISNNIQIVLTFEPVEEVQLEAVNQDGTLNEEMAN
jgi:DNA-binding transcriptional ArsR family regulator